MINIFKQIFTWWNRQTLGTFIYTLFSGKFVGEDEFGNKYYTNKKGKRWVIYKNEVEASKIPPEWHLWIHFMKKQYEIVIKKLTKSDYLQINILLYPGLSDIINLR